MQETVKLSEYVAAFQFEAIPRPLVTEMKTLLLDYLGVTLRGSKTEAARIAAEYHRDAGAARQEATIIGHGWKATAQAAGFANAVAAHSIELDDVDDLALFHFSPPVFSAALAVAESRGASGQEFLGAVTAGCEVMARISNATNPVLRDRGFHTTPVCGVFGAAAAAAILEGLSTDQVASAFGIAGAHAGGLMEMYGPSMQKRINPGPAAHNGVVAAGMAKRGYTGANTILEGERGILNAFAGQSDPSALTRDLGSQIPVYVEYKPYASARPIHNAIDCALALRPPLNGRLEAIENMTIWRHPSWAHYHQISAPRTYHEAQVSLNYSVAVALLEGAAFFDQYSEDRIRDPQIRRLSKMLQFETDPALPRGVSCRLKITLKGGRTLEHQVDYPKGSRHNPMTDEEHWVKFQALAGSRLSANRMAEIRVLVDGLENLSDITKLAALLH